MNKKLAKSLCNIPDAYNISSVILMVKRKKKLRDFR
jgi:hypothetical protein